MVFLMVVGILAQPALPEAADRYLVPTRYGFSVSGGNTYDPDSNISFISLTGAALFDYGRIWPHTTPEQLRFKIEFSPGITTRPNTQAMISANIFALYYIDVLKTSAIRPYIEG
jgi:lipid A 3-O-deacylase